MRRQNSYKKHSGITGAVHFYSCYHFAYDLLYGISLSSHRCLLTSFPAPKSIVAPEQFLGGRSSMEQRAYNRVGQRHAKKKRSVGRGAAVGHHADGFLEPSPVNRTEPVRASLGLLLSPIKLLKSSSVSQASPGRKRPTGVEAADGRDCSGGPFGGPQQRSQRHRRVWRAVSCAVPVSGRLISGKG